MLVLKIGDFPLITVKIIMSWFVKP
jgi:hypothetical protein